jgi:two-component system sensor histidine kinase AlgZ
MLFISLVVLCAARRGLAALGYTGAFAAILGFEIVLAYLVHLFAASVMTGMALIPFAQFAAMTALFTAVALAYLDVRARALAPALAEARIQALQARIRPHFLYNSINAVLSLMRSDPRRAERALEDLADLFRVLMADNRTLAPIGNEIELARQYLALEELRLGDRLRVRWNVDGLPPDALVPPLVLQPLVENAVYHGIEPSDKGGEIQIDVVRVGKEIVMELRNPFPGGGKHATGNRMAIVNIRERLQLHFDAEASMRSEVKDGFYRVVIRMPYLTAPA